MVRRLGAWDCEYCGTKKILGNVFDCPGCGRPRSKRVRFYEIPNAPIVTPEIARELGSGGPNWYCEHCDSGNKDNSNTCWNCGAERGSSPVHEVKEYRSGKTPRSTEEAERADDDDQSWVETTVSEKPVFPTLESHKSLTTSTHFPNVANIKERLFNALKFKQQIIGVAFGVVFLSILGYLFLSTHEEQVRISGFNWTQNVAIQEYQVVHKTSWTTYPEAAYNVSSDYRDTGRDRKVTDGWETVSYPGTCSEQVYEAKTCTGSRDNGDGSFSSYSYECGSYSTRSYSCTKTRQEEIYHYEDVFDWYYEYDINQWVTIAKYPTAGEDHSPYYYTDFKLTDPYFGSGMPELGQQKQLQIPGEYSVTFFCPDNSKIGEEGFFSRGYSLEEWNKFDVENNYSIKANIFNIILSHPAP